MMNWFRQRGAYKCLSRMRGNAHVRFLGGKGVVIPLTYPIAVAVAELAMQRFVRPPDAGSSPVSHLRMWCKRVAYCDRNAEARFKSDIFNHYNKTNKNM